MQLERPGRATDALSSAVARLETLKKTLKLSNDKIVDKMKDLATRRGHSYPEKVKQDGKIVRESETKYGLQRNEMLRQIEHRIAQIQKVQGNPTEMRLQHLSSVEDSIAPHLHLVGRSWANAVFEYNVCVGPPLAPMCEKMEKWLKAWQVFGVMRIEKTDSPLSSWSFLSPGTLGAAFNPCGPRPPGRRPSNPLPCLMSLSILD